MLFKLKTLGTTTTFVRLNPTTLEAEGFLEKVMEQWLADNPQAVLPDEERGVLVISQESAFQNLVDILAVDRDGNLVVIEVKRGQTPRDVIAQALEYASDVATWDYYTIGQRAMAYFHQHGLNYESLSDAFHQYYETDDAEAPEDQFNRRQRLFIVGEAIEPKVERTARWLLRHGVEISCISYACYRTGEGELFLDFAEVVRPGEIPTNSTAPSLTTSAETEGNYVAAMSPAIQSLYAEVKKRVLAFGDDVQVGATSSYVKFVSGYNFAEVHRKKDGLHVYVRPEGFSIPDGQNAPINGYLVQHVPDSRGWTLNHGFTIKPDSNIDDAEKLLRQSYQAVHGQL